MTVRLAPLKLHRSKLAVKRLLQLLDDTLTSFAQLLHRNALEHVGEDNIAELP